MWKSFPLLLGLICSIPSAGASNIDPLADAVTGVVITNVGGSGYYDDVVDMVDGTNMICPDFDAACVKEKTCVSGSLAPFDEEVSLVFRGPMNIHNIAWYEGEADSSLQRTSRWTPILSDNVIFMKNLGAADNCPGVWTICGGNSQTYADAEGLMCASEPTQFEGKLNGDIEVNIMTSHGCNSNECGFYRGVGMHGWKGGSDGTKVVVFEVDMPDCGEDGFDFCTNNRPAVWALNAKALRTAQYGCNCRGAGGNGGCGEFDIIEAVIGDEFSDMLFTTVYDFKGTGSPGSNKYFLRPKSPQHFAAIFRGGEEAYVQVIELFSWDYENMTPFEDGQLLDTLRRQTPESSDIYDVDSRETSEC